MDAIDTGLGKRVALWLLHHMGLEVVRRGPDVLVLKGEREHLQKGRGLIDCVLGQHLHFLLKQYDINCVLDVGANTGQYGVELRRAGYEGYIISFEPVSAVFAQLQQRCVDDAKWSAHNFALGSEDSRATINVAHNSSFSSFLTPLADHEFQFEGGEKVENTEEVVVRRLEFVIDEVSGHIVAPNFFLKMDTQGFDLQVLEGLGQQTDKMIGLQSEVSALPIYEGMPHHSEAIARYESLGFAITALLPVNRDEATSCVIEFDCVMARPDVCPAPDLTS